MEISHMLKEKRAEYQLTQEMLAEKILVSKKTISNWETGKTMPDINSLIRLAKLFDLSLDKLLLEGSEVVKDMEKKEKAYNNQIIFIVLMTVLFMTLIGYYSFNNLTSVLIFGIISGGISGFVIDYFVKNII